jgi:WD40 repeat protein
MKCLKIITLFTLHLYTHGAATDTRVIALTHDPKSIITALTMSADGLRGAYVLGKEKTNKKETFHSLQIYPHKSRVYVNPHNFPPAKPEYTYEVFIVDTTTGKQTECSVSSKPNNLYFSPDGKTLAISSDPVTSSALMRYIRLFDAKTCKRKQNLVQVAYDPSKDPLVYRCLNRDILYASKPITPETLYMGGGVHIAFNAESTQIVCTDYCIRQEKTVQPLCLIDLETSQLTTLYTDMTDKRDIGLCAFSPTDSHLCAAQVGAAIKIWDLREKRSQHKTIKLEHQTTDCLGFSPDNTTIYACSREKSQSLINLLSFPESTIYNTINLNDETDPTQVSFAGNSFEVILPALKSGRAHRTLIGDTTYTQAYASADEKTLLVVKEDGILYLAKETGCKPIAK